jgi:hypothetical protein
MHSPALMNTLPVKSILLHHCSSPQSAVAAAATSIAAPTAVAAAAASAAAAPPASPTAAAVVPAVKGSDEGRNHSSASSSCMSCNTVGVYIAALALLREQRPPLQLLRSVVTDRVATGQTCGTLVTAIVTIL